jgi:hypothetical protein
MRVKHWWKIGCPLKLKLKLELGLGLGLTD